MIDTGKSNKILTKDSLDQLTMINTGKSNNILTKDSLDQLTMIDTGKSNNILTKDSLDQLTMLTKANVNPGERIINFSEKAEVYKKNEVNSNYLYLLNQYHTKCNAIFFHPDEFFINDAGDIECVHGTFNKQNYASFFQMAKFPVPTANLILAIYEIIEVRKEGEARDYWNFRRYKVRNKIVYPVFFETGIEFWLLDGNLYSWRIQAFINDNTVSSYFKSVRLPNPTPMEEKSIFNWIKQALSFQNFSYPFIIRSHQMLMKWIIKKHMQKHNLHINEFINSNLFKPVEDKLNKYINESREKWDLRSNEVPEKFLEYLQLITKGNIETIDKIAILIAKMNRQHIIQPKITVFVSNNPQYIKKILMQIYENSFCRLENEPQNRTWITNFSVKELIQEKNIEKLLKCKYEAKNININLMEEKLDSQDFREFKKLICGKEVKKEDKLGYITYTSNCNYIYITNSPGQLNIYSNFLNGAIDIIKLEGIDEKLEAIDSLDEKEIYWIHTVFAAHGLRLLSNGKSLEKKSKKQTFDNKEIIKIFIDKFCKVGEEFSCYTSKIYDPYAQYFKETYNIKPIAKSSFSKIIKGLGNYKAGQPHKSSTSNARGFKGIDLDEDKFNIFLKEIAANKETGQSEGKFSTIDDLREYFLEMNEEFPEFLMKGI